MAWNAFFRYGAIEGIGLGLLANLHLFINIPRKFWGV